MAIWMEHCLKHGGGGNGPRVAGWKYEDQKADCGFGDSEEIRSREAPGPDDHTGRALTSQPHLPEPGVWVEGAGFRAAQADPGPARLEGED